MLWQAWRVAALLIAVLGIAFVAGDAATVSGTTGFTVATVSPNDLTRHKVTSVAPSHDARPDVRVGDVLRLHDDSFSERMRFLRQRAGDSFVFDRERGSPVTVRLVPAPVPPVAYVFLALAFAFIVVGALLALRTPQLAEARTLASMLILLGVVFSFSPQPWMPPVLVAAVLIGSFPVQFLAFGCAVHLATIFPARAERGWRVWVRRVNPFVSAFMMLIGGWITTSSFIGERAAPRPVTLIGQFVWLYFLIAITRRSGSRTAPRPAPTASGCAGSRCRSPSGSPSHREQAVDDVFFRSRHEAERALRMLARELAFVTDPRVAIARAHEELVARTGAADAAIYVLDQQAALRVDPADDAAPAHVDVDDAALVRLRATRAPLRLRDVRSALRGDRAYPMLVRDALSGAVVLGPKTNGEAYAPDEIATVETVAQALGNALDALQTAALKAEVARVLIDGAPLDALRRTVDSAAWVRGVVPQPAGSLLGLGE